MRLNDRQISLQNKEASIPLRWNVELVPTVGHGLSMENVRKNSVLPIPWVNRVAKHDGVALIVGKGPSLHDTWKEVQGGTIFACNSAAWFLSERGVRPDWQVVMDPIPEAVKELCEDVNGHLLASICNPLLFTRAPRPTLWHPNVFDIEDYIPANRGEFTGIGGGITVLNSTVCLAHVMGFRRFVVFGGDSSFTHDEHYATEERIPDGERLRIVVNECGRDYLTTYDLKEQVRVFLDLCTIMTDCEIKVKGYGLLPDLFNSKTGAVNA